MTTNSLFSILAAVLALAIASAQSGGPYVIDWHTIDGGGRTVQIGFGENQTEYVLGSTIGQIDAVGALGAEPYTLVGGFWAAALPCPVDLDADGFLTGTDFDQFVAAFEQGGRTADFDLDGFVTGLDFDYFVQAFERGCE